MDDLPSEPSTAAGGNTRNHHGAQANGHSRQHNGDNHSRTTHDGPSTQYFGDIINDGTQVNVGTVNINIWMCPGRANEVALERSTSTRSSASGRMTGSVLGPDIEESLPVTYEFEASDRISRPYAIAPFRDFRLLPLVISSPDSAAYPLDPGLSPSEASRSSGNTVNLLRHTLDVAGCALPPKKYKLKVPVANKEKENLQCLASPNGEHLAFCGTDRMLLYSIPDLLATGSDYIPRRIARNGNRLWRAFCLSDTYICAVKSDSVHGLFRGTDFDLHTIASGTYQRVRLKHGSCNRVVLSPTGLSFAFVAAEPDLPHARKVFWYKHESQTNGMPANQPVVLWEVIAGLKDLQFSRSGRFLTSIRQELDAQSKAHFWINTWDFEYDKPCVTFETSIAYDIGSGEPAYTAMAHLPAEASPVVILILRKSHLECFHLLHESSRRLLSPFAKDGKVRIAICTTSSRTLLIGRLTQKRKTRHIGVYEHVSYDNTREQALASDVSGFDPTRDCALVYTGNGLHRLIIATHEGRIYVT